MKSNIRIVSDGTGAGTVITVGGVKMDGVTFLNINIPDRGSVAKITMTMEADIELEAEVVMHGNPNYSGESA